MEQENYTSRVNEFVLLGLSQHPEHQRFLFVIFLFIYLATWLGNLTIIITVICDYHLHTPMYFLLANLALMEVSESSITAPKLLQTLLSQHKSISYNGCIIQMFCIHFIGGTVIFFLVAMAADRYLAIHKPLQYMTIMNWNMCLKVMVIAWTVAFLHAITVILMVIQLPFCGPNILDNFYCDIPQVVQLACTDTYIVELFIISNSGLIITGVFTGLLISYTIILLKIRNHLLEGKQKAVSTCAAQITVVSLHLISCAFVYDRPLQKFPEVKFVSVIYTVISPVLNPIIYTLRNTEMKNAIRRLAGKVFFSHRGSKMQHMLSVWV
ncbi:PREDICTED: olfactory receptor 4D9-like [Gekko japonicus]|uniref:Olfactory receptor 4D9-like n=1 Tax=Gekko japonicus TaxID=146911 RepID=A0ABM1K4J9_GEKJA|nr:PREDICTED: olfactory receptor 4D9-like [Gekko japonicus]